MRACRWCGQPSAGKRCEACNGIAPIDPLMVEAMESARQAYSAELNTQAAAIARRRALGLPRLDGGEIVEPFRPLKGPGSGRKARRRHRRIQLLAKRDGGLECAYCARAFESETDPVLTIEHVTPVSKGGTNHPDNQVLACQDCNARKGADDLPTWARRRAAELLAPSRDKALKERQDRVLAGFALERALSR